VQLTRDHSLLQDYLDAGLMTEEEAATSDLRNVVTRAMGVDTHVDLDVQEHAVQGGDVFLLCSDGLSDMVDDATIRELLLAEPDLARAAEALVAAANARGGRDNIAVLLARASSA
jgi:protein phosphatase